jgi:hypothetical protein
MQNEGVPAGSAGETQGGVAMARLQGLKWL